MVKHRRGKTHASQKAGQRPANVQTVIQIGLQDNPDVRVVLENAARAVIAGSADLPRPIDMLTETTVTVANSQYQLPG